jgi:hypothetical protein
VTKLGTAIGNELGSEPWTKLDAPLGPPLLGIELGTDSILQSTKYIYRKTTTALLNLHI